MLLTAQLLLLASLPLSQEPDAPVTSEPSSVFDAVESVEVQEPQEPIVVEVPMGQEPLVTDVEAEALSAWLAEDGPEWDSPTDQFFRDMSFGLTLDLMTEFTEKEDTIEEYNDLRIRGAQINFASPVYGTGHAFATIDFSDGGDGTDFVLREAGAWIEDFAGDLVPGRMDAQVGKYYADLGAWNTVMANEFGAPSLDGVRRSFFGGNMVMTGAELHHGMPIQGGYFRWSAGLAGDVESQDVDMFGNGLDATGPAGVGRRGFSNWAGTARASLQLNFGSGIKGRAGASVYYAPDQPLFTDLGGGSTERLEARNALCGLDLGFLWEVADSTMSHELSAELWISDAEFRSGPGTLADDESRGEWMMYEFVYDAHWSAGALVSRNDVLGLPGPVDSDASYHSGFVTYSVNESNRFSMFLTHTNPGYVQEKFFTVGAQWVFDLGAKRANSIARWH